MRKLLQVSAGLTGAFLLICLAVILVVNFRQIYYHDISELHIEQETGLSAEALRENYDVLIDYNLIWTGKDTLTFPDFPMSESGRIHFADVRRIFFAFQYAAIVLAVLYAGQAVLCAARRRYGFLRITAVLTLVIPAALGVFALLDWERLFIGFHRLAFRNDYWLFDPATDPVINALPDTFFFHCAAAILILVLLGSILCEIAYRILRNN